VPDGPPAEGEMAGSGFFVGASLLEVPALSSSAQV
jgi:hypothetical protein